MNHLLSSQVPGAAASRVHMDEIGSEAVGPQNFPAAATLWSEVLLWCPSACNMGRGFRRKRPSQPHRCRCQKTNCVHTARVSLLDYEEQGTR